MNSRDRRLSIKEILEKSNKPQKGHVLAEKLGVTRQVIVKDIAILRAEGKSIIATPDGYLIPKVEEKSVRKVIAVSHKTDEMEEELKTIVKFGGKIEDVIVEHPVYGEIKGMLMIKNLYDVDNFLYNINKYKAEPLLILTGGVHLHTIVADNYDILENIINALKEKGYIISE
ncbi:transcription repressor NadR [Clostridium luticellarii]|uniref:Putative transcription repressor NiaR n=1 Tax=Clostridium luticellarii TaxID=1691940 RepID=A0A2T0BAH4_9CLOT|nr:transcription repressor NadR [Clostridium luticellarii]MCI1946348.1 transcription repressor NadR [Clostridium luticellarii]MCI1969585.1 transcription repressor NadR [Clostridium luticellarii]MCI1996756.1 transcription repressor NadR [Clostridium luticellarii]PRR80890.1 putative transcription repressor NiaR [Clostridium luticellarii]